jgi:ribosomal protein S18 acetylase RimI-like enzyme
MRANEFVTEIERLSKGQYTGGKDELNQYSSPGEKKLQPLPGGSGFQYAVIGATSEYPSVLIVDPSAQQPYPVRGRYEFDSEFNGRVARWEQTKGRNPVVIAKLILERPFAFPVKDALQVGSITVDEDYRGRGLAKALYGIVLSIMKRPLVAGESQTPGGRANWLSLASIPGVEVKGFIQMGNIDLDTDDLDPTDVWDRREIKQKENQIDIIMGKLGGQYLGTSRGNEYWEFDVVAGRGELAPAVRTTMSKIYNTYNTGLIATWHGQ